MVTLYHMFYYMFIWPHANDFLNVNTANLYGNTDKTVR